MADKRKTCAEANCRVKGFWYETIGDKKLICFHGKHHGEKHIVKLELPEGVAELRPLQSFTESEKFLEVSAL